MGWQEIGWYLALGAFVGLVAGLFGVGGGGVMVPTFTSLFALQHFPREHLVHMALATSMAAIIPTSIASLRAHHAHGAVLWSLVWKITPGILVGTFAATFLASQLDALPLAIFFTCFMAYVALQIWLNIKPKPSRQLPTLLGTSLVGVGIGAVSALVAIGGGSLSVPFMTYCNVKIQHAIGTSAAIGLPLAIAGTVGYLVNGWSVPNLPPYTIGYIYLPAVVLVSAVSFFTAPLGAKLAHSLPVTTLKRGFAVVMFSLSLKMLYTVITH
ncbi:sulfite exporter TauE/SafE family protein [Thiofilum flexile]|uniref:sulfite exporter TauE/SafE family protein n=1 Tax=Thiofilum flexile TaxID=125627 RepID=UPI00036E53E9|nr:sulfite exporter TauE/SafE family protein [Thiofilum flexile]